MITELSNFAARLRFAGQIQDNEFNKLALDLFALQFKYNPAYTKICEGRGATPAGVKHWMQIPFVPTAAFKELELSCIPPEKCAAVFHSSGTTEQKPSRHFHCAQSLKIYETASWKWFAANVADSKNFELIALTPPPRLAPHSSLVHMFDIIRRELNAPETAFTGKISADGSWILNFDTALAALNNGSKPKLILGAAFSFVHLLDFLAEKNLRLQLSEGSRVMETGGYKNRSRAMPKIELHLLIAQYLGISLQDIICEYGMSELSSQAYDTSRIESLNPSNHPTFQICCFPLPCGGEGLRVRGKNEIHGKSPPPSPSWRREIEGEGEKQHGLNNVKRHFHFPPWARAQIVSPETGEEVADGGTGLIRVFDLANVFSVAAIQTEDLAARRGDGFELIGRAPLAEPRGCSLLTG